MPALTGIRGVAAIWVMSYHIYLYSSNFGVNDLMPAPIFASGWAGVDLFFCLSGFILMSAHGAEFVNLDLQGILSFAKIRISRVYPLNFVVLFFIIALTATNISFATWYKDLAPGNLSLIAFAKTATLSTRWFLPGRGDWNQPTWSLSVELIGYAFFPFLVYAIHLRVKRWTSLAISIFCFLTLAISQILSHHFNTNEIGAKGAVIRMTLCFVGGVCACRFRLEVPKILAQYAGAIGVSSVTGLVISTLLGEAIVMPPLFCVLIFSLSFNGSALSRLASNRWSMFLGRVSFPLYLIHVMPLLYLAHFVGARCDVLKGAILLSLYVAFCLGAAWIAHVTIERTFQKLGHAWARSERLF